MSKVELELLKATKQKKKTGKEATQDFLRRVFDAIQELEDEEWNELSTEAQAWANEAAKLDKKKKSLPPFPEDKAEEEDEDEDEDEDADADADGEEEDEDEDEDEDEAPAKKPGKKDDKKSAKPDPKAKKDDKKSTDKKKSADAEKAPATTGRKSGVTTLIKKIMLKNPGISKEDLIAELEKKVGPVSDMTASTVRADFRQSLQVMRDEGCLSDAMVKKMEKADKK